MSAPSAPERKASRRSSPRKRGPSTLQRSTGFPLARERTERERSARGEGSTVIDRLRGAHRRAGAEIAMPLRDARVRRAPVVVGEAKIEIRQRGADRHMADVEWRAASSPASRSSAARTLCFLVGVGGEVHFATAAGARPRYAAAAGNRVRRRPAPGGAAPSGAPCRRGETSCGRRAGRRDIRRSRGSRRAPCRRRAPGSESWTAGCPASDPACGLVVAATVRTRVEAVGQSELMGDDHHLAHERRAGRPVQLHGRFRGYRLSVAAGLPSGYHSGSLLSSASTFP